MNQKIDKTLIITTLLCLLPLVLSAFLYDKLPEQVAIHFNASGTADDYASKAFAAFGLPLLFAGLNIILQIVLNNDPKRNNAHILSYLSKWLLPLLSLVFIPLTLFHSLGYPIGISRLVPIFMALLFLVIGNYLPKCKQNYSVGIRLPWTLNSETNWNKTHRLAGWIWTIAAIIILISALLDVYTNVVIALSLIVMVGVPGIYSFFLYKQEQKEDTTDTH
ncbi:MAG: SdpI family protein [Sphaerochaeta sp.]|nr:SdpI family protein [Sphaerochaeta sp.]